MIKILLNDPQAPRGSQFLIANIHIPLSELHGKGALAEIMGPLAIVGVSLWRDQRRPGYVNIKLPSTTTRGGGNFDFLRGAADDNLEAGFAIQRFNAFVLALFVAALPDHEAAPLAQATLDEHPGITRGGPLPDLSTVKVAVASYGQPVRTATPPAAATPVPTPVKAPNVVPTAAHAPEAQPGGQEATVVKGAGKTPATAARKRTPASSKAKATAKGPSVVVTPATAPKASRGAQAATLAKARAVPAAEAPVATPTSKKTSAKRATKADSEKLSSKPAAADPLAGLSLDQLKEAVWQFEQEKQHGKGAA